MKQILALVFVLVLTVFASAQNRPGYRIVADDGRPVANHALSPDTVAAVEKLPGAVVAGNPRGNVTIFEFYDLNCPYCRRASADLDAMIRADPGLRLVLVPYPVLGIASVLAGRVELAVAKTVSPERFYEFHRRIYAGRGVIDGQRALSVVRDMKLDEQKLLSLADDDDTTDIMKTHARLGNAMGFVATPSFMVAGHAIVGYPGRKAMEKIVSSVRACGKAAC